MAFSARGERAWTLLTVLAIAILCSAARDLLQTLATVETQGPFDAAVPADCAQLCTDQEGCRGYRWRGGMCNLTIQADSDGNGTLAVTTAPIGEAAASTDAPEPSNQTATTETVSPPTAEPAPAPTNASAPSGPEKDPDNGNDTVPTMEEIIEFITECRNTGSLASSAAALAACQVVLNKCPVPPMNASAKVVPLSLSDDPPLPAVEQLEAALDEACKRETIETCKRESFPSAEVLVPDCVRVLNLGPNVSVVDCEDTRVANQIFAEEVATICEA